MKNPCEFMGECKFYQIHGDSPEGRMRMLVEAYCSDRERAEECKRHLVRRIYDAELDSCIGPCGKHLST